ncbi:MAG: endoglucanase [Actinomycetota bacterium]
MSLNRRITAAAALVLAVVATVVALTMTAPKAAETAAPTRGTVALDTESTTTSLAVAPTTTPPPASASARGQRRATVADGRFHVRGRDVTGPAGSVVTLRGVSKSGLEYSVDGYDVSQATFDRMRSWGANVVRVALSDRFALPEMCNFDASYLSTIDEIVSYGEQLKMLIVLDDHFATRGLACGRGAWSANQKAPDEFNLAFVKMLGLRYKDRPYVAIDLYNEPHDINWETWQHGGNIDDAYTAVGMQDLLDGVRSTGFNGLVFATGPQWGNDLRSIATEPLRNDADVVYGAHEYPYTCGTTTVPQSEPYECNGHQYPGFLDNQIAPAIATRAVMLTEFGTQRPSDGEMRAPIQWAEDHHIGWIAWLWCSGDTTNYCLLTPDHTNTPSVIGKPVQDFLFKANGWTTLNGR